MSCGLFDLSGKVALVTGGNGGIGLGMAEGLAAQGASVVTWGTKSDKKENALGILRALGGEVRCVQVDVRRGSSGRRHGRDRPRIRLH